MKITAFRLRDHKWFTFQIYTIYPLPYLMTVNGVDIACRVPAWQSGGWSMAVAVELNIALPRIKIDHLCPPLSKICANLHSLHFLIYATHMLFIEENRLSTIDDTKRSDPTVDIESNARLGLHDRVTSNGLWSSPLLHHYTCGLFIPEDI